MNRFFSLLTLVGATGFLVATACLIKTCTVKQNIAPKTIAELRIGMTEVDIESILGCPAGDYSTGRAEYWPEFDEKCLTLLWPDPLCRKLWVSDDGWVSVDFDKSGKAAFLVVNHAARVKGGFLQSLLGLIRPDSTKALDEARHKAMGEWLSRRWIVVNP